MGWEALIDPILNLGAGAFSYMNNKKTQVDPYVNYLKHQEDQNYQNAVARRDYDLQMQDYQNRAAAASRANAAARASAARQTEANRQKAATKANKALMAGYDKAIKMYDPYVSAGPEVFGSMVNTFKNGQAGINNALAMMSQPAFQQQMFQNASPIWNQNVPLPDFFKKGK